MYQSVSSEKKTKTSKKLVIVLAISEWMTKTNIDSVPKAILKQIPYIQY